MLSSYVVLVIRRDFHKLFLRGPIPWCLPNAKGLIALTFVKLAKDQSNLAASVGDPDLQDPHVLAVLGIRTRDPVSF
jgi:hypothetical protein